MTAKIVLAYSGGLDTSVVLRWLQEKYESEVVTLTVDLGQQEDLNRIAQLAENSGSVKHHSLDCQEEFAEDYVFPSIRANGLYQGMYPLGTALARPLIARKLVEIANKEGADAVAHGCTGKGNDQVRFEVTVKHLAPHLKILAPVREWNLSRDEEERYAKKWKIPVKSEKSAYSIDQNLWGRSVEGGEIYDTEKEPPIEAFEWTTPPDKTPDRPRYVKLGFENGVPASIDGKRLAPVPIIARLNRIAGLCGVGIRDHIEDRVVGIKTREVYECPAAICLLQAHQDLEKLVLTRHELSFKHLVDLEWTWLVYSGLWVEPLRSDLQAFIDSTQSRVSGTVTLKMFKSSSRVVGRSSPFSLYSYDLATYESSSTFDQKEARGFIDLWGLPSQQAGLISSAGKKSIASNLRAKVGK